MKRRKASAKMTNVVHSGWMIKSPPERKLNAPFKIFRSQWKKRFFVLRKPSGSLPDQYELYYYKDEYCNAKKGSIDLEQCEQIIEALDSDIFPNLLAIKTYYKNKVRTYYLAVDTEQEMNSWVQWLCYVCGLKPEDQPTDIPEPKPAVTTSQVITLTTAPSISNGRPASPARVNHSPTASVLLVSPPHTAGGTDVIDSQPLARTSSDSSLPYIPLEHCTTGQPQPVDRRESVESVPDFPAPEPPQKRHGNQNNGLVSDDDVFVPGIYDHPPKPLEVPKCTSSSDLYKVPPARPTGGHKLMMDEDVRNSSYDVPPSHDHSPRSSLSVCTDSGASGGAEGRSSTPTECYDYPPRRNSSTSSDNEVPPERPPKPSYLQSPYQNLPPAQKVSDVDLMNTVPAPPKPHTSRHQSGYDVPRSASHRPSRTQQNGLSLITQVPTQHSRQTTIVSGAHTYFNTHSSPGSGDLQLTSKSGVDYDKDSVGGDLAEGGTGPPAIPPPRMGSTGEQLDPRSVSPSLHQSPPVSASSSLSGAPARPPARGTPQSSVFGPRDGSLVQGQGQADDNSVIFSTKRTRSFKRHNNVNNSLKLNHKTNSLPISAPVPAPRPVLPSRPKDMSTSEEEEEAISRLNINDPEEETHHPLSLLHSVPAPSSDNDRELKYIDLALPGAGQEAPRPSHLHGHTHSHPHSHADRGKESATEYREIDFIKTQALNDAKRVKDKERKIDEH